MQMPGLGEKLMVLVSSSSVENGFHFIPRGAEISLTALMWVVTGAKILNPVNGKCLYQSFIWFRILKNDPV